MNEPLFQNNRYSWAHIQNTEKKNTVNRYSWTRWSIFLIYFLNPHSISELERTSTLWFCGSLRWWIMTLGCWFVGHQNCHITHIKSKSDRIRLVEVQCDWPLIPSLNLAFRFFALNLIFRHCAMSCGRFLLTRDFIHHDIWLLVGLSWKTLTVYQFFL
jgi:hypothetical protein